MATARAALRVPAACPWVWGEGAEAATPFPALLCILPPGRHHGVPAVPFSPNQDPNQVPQEQGLLPTAHTAINPGWTRRGTGEEGASCPTYRTCPHVRAWLGQGRKPRHWCPLQDSLLVPRQWCWRVWAGASAGAPGEGWGVGAVATWDAVHGGAPTAARGCSIPSGIGCKDARQGQMHALC